MEQVFSLDQPLYALQHIDTQEYVCMLHNNIDHLVCFTDGDSALQFRADLNLHEYVDMVVTTVNKSPFNSFWLNGQAMHATKGERQSA